MDEGHQAGSHGQDETEDESANFPTKNKVQDEILENELMRIRKLS